jgi:cytochrome c-type biogenesis protein
METWIHNVLNSGQGGISVLVALFFLGMIGVVTCGCNYAIFAVVAGYSGSQSPGAKAKTLVLTGVAFLLGAVLAMAAIGALFGYAGNLISNSFGNYWKIAAGLLCIFFGLYSMDFLPFSLPALKIKNENQQPGLLPAILFGLIVGGLATAFNTCCNPLFPIILAASFVKGSAVWGLTMLTSFALGYAFPLALGLVGVRLGVGKLSATVSAAGTILKYSGGILLVLMGFYFLLTL